MGENFTNTGEQKYVYSARMNNLMEGVRGSVIVSGCDVSENGTPNMTVDNAAGIIRIAGDSVTVAAANTTINAADGSLDRIDTISVGANATVDYNAGTPAANPIAPVLAANHVLLATVRVATGDTSITDSEISDARIIDSPMQLTQNNDSTVTLVALNTTIGSSTIPANTFRKWFTVVAAGRSAGGTGDAAVGLIAKKAGGSDVVLGTTGFDPVDADRSSFSIQTYVLSTDHSAAFVPSSNCTVSIVGSAAGAVYQVGKFQIVGM